MMHTDLHEADKTTLSDLVKQMKEGEEIVLEENGTPVAKLVSLSKPTKEPRKPGALRGKIWMADDFDEWPEDYAFPFGKA